ncbi:MAG: hypothetical protein FWF75_09080 [Propionibacteriaceae bacterium]|nr:hypothetical protein [Propionibacteriaceae bacterium]
MTAPAEVVGLLREGNRRFLAERPRARGDMAALRARLAQANPHPYAAVLACSDPRVCPELILDAQLGELFVVRTAGNVVDDIVCGSIEFAVRPLGAPVVVVLGHSRCGAVAAALAGAQAGPALASLVAHIPVGSGADAAQVEDDNIAASVAQLRSGLAPWLEPAAIVAAKYDLESGVVDFGL